MTPSIRSLHWVKIKERISVDYKILSLTYKVLTATEPSYLHYLISLQSLRSTRSSDVVTLARPTSYSSLKVNNRSFRHASPRLWNELPKELREPVDDESLSLHCHLIFLSPVYHHHHYHHHHHHHFHYSSLHLRSTPDSINSFLHSHPHLFGRISRIFMAISGLNCSSVFLLFCSFRLFCLIRVID